MTKTPLSIQTAHSGQRMEWSSGGKINMRKTWFFTLCVMLVLFCWTSSSHAFEIKKAKNIQRADLLGVVGEVEKSNMVSRMKKKLEKC